MEENGRILIHCQAGVSRSATIIMAYLMKYYGMSSIDAFLFTRSRRLEVVVQPNEQFMYELLEFEQLLTGFRSISFMDLCNFVYEINSKYGNDRLLQ